MASTKSWVARPELKIAAHTAPIPTDFAPADVVMTSDQMRRGIKKLREEGDMSVQSDCYRPKEWWDCQYESYDNHTRYYEDKYGARNSGNLALICRYCENERCGWVNSERHKFVDRICPSCQKMRPCPLDPRPGLTPGQSRRSKWLASLRQAKLRRQWLIKVVELADITRLKLPT